MVVNYGCYMLLYPTTYANLISPKIPKWDGDSTLLMDVDPPFVAIKIAIWPLDVCFFL